MKVGFHTPVICIKLGQHSKDWFFFIFFLNLLLGVGGEVHERWAAGQPGGKTECKGGELIETPNSMPCWSTLVEAMLPLRLPTIYTTPLAILYQSQKKILRICIFIQWELFLLPLGSLTKKQHAPSEIGVSNPSNWPQTWETYRSKIVCLCLSFFLDNSGEVHLHGISSSPADKKMGFHTPVICIKLGQHSKDWYIHIYILFSC